MRRPEWLAERGGMAELLRVPAALFGAASRLRAGLYDRGLLPSARLDVPVVSVGNLSTGGTGKTPFVVLVCRLLAQRGRRPGILSRGYGAPADGPGDEARMLRDELPDVPHVADPDRVRGAQELLRTGCDVLVLDDGFQHRRLRRDLDLVLVDATRPWGLPAPPAGGEHVCAVLPRGLLRESPRALARADALVLTRTDQLAPAALERLEAELERWAPGRPILLATHRPRALRRLDGAPLADARPAALAGQAVELVSGIGNPEAFAATVRSLGAEVRAHRAFPDHHAYTEEDLAGLGGGGAPILTTEKDAVKLASFGVEQRERVLVLSVELALGRGAGVLEALFDALPRGARERARRGLHEGLHG